MSRLTTDEIAREQAVWTRSGWSARRAPSWLDAAAVVLLLAALLVSGCCTLPPPRPCKLEPPPELRELTFVRPGERGCPELPPKAERGPETLAACLTSQGAADVAATVRALDGWNRDAWTSCGP